LCYETFYKPVKWPRYSIQSSICVCPGNNFWTKWLLA